MLRYRVKGHATWLSDFEMGQVVTTESFRDAATEADIVEAKNL